jgi:hypothetical protein
MLTPTLRKCFELVFTILMSVMKSESGRTDRRTHALIPGNSISAGLTEYHGFFICSLFNDTFSGTQFM